jgi:hypothetical protein
VSGQRIGGARFGENGMASAFVAVVAASLLLIGGFAVDMGRAIAEQRVAADEAEQAARAGSGQISVQGLRDGQVLLNDGSATSSALSFMSMSGHPGSVSVQDGVVTTRVTIAMPTSILGMIGIKTITVSATASSSNLFGVTRSA